MFCVLTTTEAMHSMDMGFCGTQIRVNKFRLYLCYQHSVINCLFNWVQHLNLVITLS